MPFKQIVQFSFDNAAQKFQIAWLYLILNLHKSLDVNCEKRQVETLTVRFHQSQYIWESQERPSSKRIRHTLKTPFPDSKIK